MAQIKWLGGPGDPPVNTWKGIAFPKGKWVDIEDPSMITRAKANQFYEVRETAIAKPAPEPEPEPELDVETEQELAELDEKPKVKKKSKAR